MAHENKNLIEVGKPRTSTVDKNEIIWYILHEDIDQVY